MSDEDIDAGILRLVRVYSKALPSDFRAESHQFIYWYKEQRPEEAAKTESDQVMLQMLHTVIHHVFPNTEIALRNYLSLMATNCSGERSFSQLKIIKNVKRSTLGKQGLGTLAHRCIESDLRHKTDSKNLTDKSAVAKAREVVIQLL